MKKNILLSFVFIASLFVLGTSEVNAKSCSGIKAAPHMYQVAPTVRVDTEPLTTAYGTCKGSNTEVWFSSPQTLPNSWTYANGVIWIDLYEEDPPGNADEHVKEYAGMVENKTIWEFRLVRTLEYDNIDSEGDSTCELYLTFYSSGYQGYTIDKSLFNYKICMN